MPEPKPIRFRAVVDEDGMMLFALVARRLPKLGKAGAKELVKAGAVYMGNVRIRVPTVRVVQGERITAYPEALELPALTPDDLVIVHEDPSFIVVDKPAGVAATATKYSARGTLSDALIKLLESRGIARPYVGVVHRLDQPASGLVLFTTRSVANKSLHQQFVNHSIERIYRVGVTGDPPEALTCEVPLIEDRAGRMRVAKEGESGAQPATTHFKRLAPGLLEARLETGRTHQIRVHAAHAGFAVRGDAKYGEAPTDAEAPPRLELHAARMRFQHPSSGKPVDVQATLPAWARSDAD